MFMSRVEFNNPSFKKNLFNVRYSTRHSDILYIPYGLYSVLLMYIFLSCVICIFHWFKKKNKTSKGFRPWKIEYKIKCSLYMGKRFQLSFSDSCREIVLVEATRDSEGSYVFEKQKSGFFFSFLPKPDC